LHHLTFFDINFVKKYSSTINWLICHIENFNIKLNNGSIFEEKEKREREAG